MLLLLMPEVSKQEESVVHNPQWEWQIRKRVSLGR